MAAHKTGGDVDAYCNKCKMVLAHVVIAMNGTRLVRVECKTCHSLHAYRKEATVPKAGASRAKAPRTAAGRAAVSASDYDRVIKDRDMSRAQPYRTAVTYAESDIIEHSSFGLGIVSRLLADGKLEVLFPTSTKVLVHGRA